MADLNKIVRQVEYRSDTSGLDKVAASADKANAATKKLSDTSSALASSTEKADKSALGVATQLDRLSKAADPAQKALAAVERQQRLIDVAVKQGRPIRQEWTNALSILKAKHEEASKAVGEHTKTVGLNRIQMMELGHVARSLADDFGAGTLGVRSFMMEGGRISQLLSEGGGGITGGLKAMGTTVARLATGWLGLGVAVAAGAGLAAAAILRLQSQQGRLVLSLNGAGRYAGVTASGLAGIADAAGARNPGLGQGGATNLAATLASTGRISAGVMPGILDLATPYARGTGQDLTKAGEELAKAFADPGKGAEQLNEKLGFLDDKTKQLISSLERQGDLLGAQQVLLERAADAASHMSDQTWSISRAWGTIENAVGGTANAIGRFVTPRSTAERLQSAYGQRDELSQAPSFFGRADIFSRSGAARRGANDNQILGLNYQIYGETRGASDTAVRAAADKSTNDLSLKIGDAIRRAVPELDKSQELTDTLKLLTDALSNPDVVSKTKGGGGAISEAISRTQGELYYAKPETRAQIEGTLSAQAAQAQTAVERTAIDARRAEIEVIAAGGSAALAAAKSLNVWNDEIAKSNKEADDALRNANQRAGLAGLSPFARGAQEIRYRYDEMGRNAVTGPISSLSPDDLRMTALDSSTSILAKAMLSRQRLPINGDLSAAEELTGAFPSASAVAGAARIGSNAGAARRLVPSSISVPSTSSATRGQALGVDIGAYYDEQTIERLRRSTEELDRNKALLDVRTKSIGMNTDAMTKAVHVQEDWNELQLTDNDKKLLGTQRVKALGDQIDTLATKQTAYDKQQQQLNDAANASSYVQQTGNSIVSNLGGDLGDLFNANPRNLVSQLKVGDQAKYYAGQLSGSDVKNKIFQMQAGNFLRNLIFQQGIGLVQKGLFGAGQYGSPGYQSGLFGGLFNSLLGGAGGLFGGGGGASGGSFSGLNSLFSSGFSFASGGIMTNRGAVPLQRYEGGGVANSPQLAMFGEGRSPEAYVPLPDGRSIPVAMKGGGGNQISVGGHTIVIQGSADDKAIAQMRAELAASNKQMVADLQRNMGQMQAKWSQRNGS